jgi:hypothetical protein
MRLIFLALCFLDPPTRSTGGLVAYMGELLAHRGIFELFTRFPKILHAGDFVSHVEAAILSALEKQS